MRRCALGALGIAALAMQSRPLAAHGPPPAALSILAEDALGPTFVRLNGGLARRERPNEFRFVCPAAWGDELTLPAAAIPGGPVVVAGGRGLFLLDAEGRASPHPDPSAAGAASDFAQLGEALFALRSAGGMTEVLQIDAERVRTVFTDRAGWASIAATDEFLGLQRVNGDRLEQLRITAAGEPIDRTSAIAPEGAYLVLARATARELYAVVATPRGRELGQIDADNWRSLELAGAAIAGPIDVSDGAAWVAIDSELVRLPEPRVALADTAPVTCLGRSGAHAYACTREGVSVIADTGLTEPIFALSSLRPPDLTRVDEPKRAACQLQWEHFRFDLLALGVALRETSEPAAVDAGDSPDAAAEGGGARRAGSGCQLGSARSPGVGFALLAALFASACLRRRRGSPHQRQRTIEQAEK